MAAKLDYGATWKDTLALLRAHKEMLAAVAGVFFVLPMLLTELLFPETPASESGEASIAYFNAVYADYWWLILLVLIAAMIGNLVVYMLLVDPRRPTVGAAIGVAAGLVPTLFVVQILTGIATMIGFILLIVPGLYVWSRLIPVGPALAAERIYNPFRALARGWEVSRSNGFAILGLFVIVIIVAVVILLVVSMIVGIIFAILLPDSLETLILGIFNAFVSGLFSLVFAALTAAVYRNLTADTVTVPPVSAGD